MWLHKLKHCDSQCYSQCQHAAHAHPAAAHTADLNTEENTWAIPNALGSSQGGCPI